MRRSRRDQRGFALLIVVMLVALLALTGAALLDIVHVDLSLSSEHSKIVRAQMVSDGALREVLSDVNTGNQLPLWDACAGGTGGPPVPGLACPNLRYNWASEVNNQFVKNPDGIPPTGASPLDETNSVFARRTNTPDSEENYTATVDLLKFGPVLDSGGQTVRAMHFEVNTTGKVGGNRTRYETSAEIYTELPAAPDGALTQYHFR